MELSLRPYVTAGVAVAGAGLIAAAPVGPPALDIQTRAVQLASVDDAAADITSAAASLTGDQEFPVTTWADVFTNTFANLEDIGPQLAQDPTPILSTIEANQLGYLSDLATAAETSGTNLVNGLQELPTVLSKASADLTSGDFYDAQTLISQYLTELPLNVTRPLDNGFFEVAQSITNNLDNLFEPQYQNYVSDLSTLGNSSTPEWFTELVQAPLLAPHAAEIAFAGVGQDIVDAMQNGDTTLAFNDLLNAPSTVVDAFLNGYNLDDGGISANFVDAVPDIMKSVSAEGLLSENGTVETEREALTTVAGDIGAKRAEETLADASAATSSSADLNTVTGDVSTLLNPDTPLGEVASLFDPNAVADISSLLSADLAPNASGWVVDLFSAL
jgi:hypothetical protein